MLLNVFVGDIDLRSDGNIRQCLNSNANIMCEKYLVKGTIMCLNKTTLSQNIATNASTTLAFPVNFYPSMCIEHCRAIDGQTYAIVDESSCTCATKLLFNASGPTNSAAGVFKDMTQCGDTSSYSKIGSPTGKLI